LRVFILKICEKIIAICQGDVEVSLNFFEKMIFLLESSVSKDAGEKFKE
jgi:hypothetical protein